MEFIEYFQAPTDGFWHWDEDATVISFVNGPTICYRDYLIEVLQTLEPQGVPPLTSLLLAIASTNQFDQNEVQKRVSSLPNVGKNKKNVHDFSGSLSRLPKDYLTGEKRLLVFQSIFQNCHNVYRSKGISQVLNNLYDRNYDVEWLLQKSSRGSSTRDYKTFGLLGLRFKSVQDILDAMLAYDQVKFEEEIVLTRISNEDEKGFVDQLIENPKTFQIGSLIKRIWSGLHIPQNHSVSQTLPLGGFADISNKGDFDKLLISEFAFDDLSMVSRLANNEALFIQKDVPPSDNKKQRIILLDVGLKNWGRAKTFAFAAALSLANHPKEERETLIYLIGQGYTKMNHDSIDGVIEANSVLSPTLDNSEGFSSFFKEVNTTKTEVVFIAEQSVLQHISYAKTFNHYSDKIHFVVQVSNEGQIDLYQNGGKGKKHLQKMEVPYKQLWSKNPKVVNTSEESSREPQKYPILLVSNGPIVGFLDGHYYRMTAEGALLKRYYRTDLVESAESWHEDGYEIVYTDVGRRKHQFCLGENEQKQLVLLSYQKHTYTVVIENLATKERITKSFEALVDDEVNTQDFVFFDSKFHCQDNITIKSIDLDGVVTEEPLNDVLRNKFQSSSNKLSDYGYKSGDFLKNVQTVFVNKFNELTFNKHRLFVNNEEEVKFKIAPERQVSDNRLSTEIIADIMHNGLFCFQEGSTIEIDRNGIFILTSSNQAIDRIYVNGQLDVPIGFATNDYFAGDSDNLKKGNRYTVGVKVANITRGTEKFDEFREILSGHGFVMDDNYDLANDTCALDGLVSEEESLDIINDLEEIGVIGYANCVEEVKQKTISAKDFYERFVQKFIDNIVNHEANS